MWSKVCTVAISGAATCSLGIFAFAALIVCPTAGNAASLKPEEAAGHVGENVTVCGVVASTKYAAQAPTAPTFLNFGKPYPNQIFTAVILGSDRKKFGAPEISLRDKSVCVTGEIFLYQGTPEIALRDPTQFSER
jgi:DNA/RNA endonuclease YhcR with UshA esterase domain